MSGVVPQTREDLTENDVVLHQNHRSNKANELWRGAVEELVKSMSSDFFKLKLKERADIINEKLQNNVESCWKYWVPSSEGQGTMYEQASQRDVLTWTKKVIQSATKRHNFAASSSSSASASSSSTMQNGDRETSLQDLGQVVEATHIGKTLPRKYEKTKAGKAWLSLFGKDCKDLDYHDMEEVLTDKTRNPSAGDFSVVASLSHISHRQSEQALAKLVVLKANLDMKTLYWFYDTRDGKFYSANKETGAVGRHHDSLGSLLKTELFDCGITRWNFKRHDRHDNYVLKIMTQAAQVANMVPADDGSSSKRPRPSFELFGDLNSESSISTMTFNAPDGTNTNVEQNSWASGIEHEQV